MFIFNNMQAHLSRFNTKTYLIDFIIAGNIIIIWKLYRYGTSCVVYWVNVLLRLKSLVYSFISQRKPWPTGCLCLALPAVLLINCGHCCTASTPNKSNQSLFSITAQLFHLKHEYISHLFFHHLSYHVCQCCT